MRGKEKLQIVPCYLLRLQKYATQSRRLQPAKIKGSSNTFTGSEGTGQKPSKRTCSACHNYEIIGRTEAGRVCPARMDGVESIAQKVKMATTYCLVRSPRARHIV